MGLRNRRVLFFLPLVMVTDMVLWGLMYVPSACFTYALLYTCIATHASLGMLGIVGCAALIFRFIASGTTGIDLLVLLPLSWALYYTRSVADIPRPYLVGIIGSGVLLHNIALAGSGDLQRVVVSFLSAGIMLYLVTGSQGNRSYS